uniref:Sulfotransferase family cytosolic 1B member 1 n=1 Tax=Culex pipiens TaxID=7175 RepID=A0A8D8JXN2_CULPI
MFDFKPLEFDEADSLSCPGAPTFVEVQLKNSPEETKPCVLPAKFVDYADRIRNFQVYEDDVWIVTFPKCGTTWTQEMVWLIDHGLDYDTAKQVNLNARSVFFELGAVGHNIPVDTVTTVENLPRPRHIKSHLPLVLLPQQLWTVKPRIVYVSRNPKDVAVSYLHHYQMIMGFRGSKDTFLRQLAADKVMYCPQVQHVLEFWRVRAEPNVLFLSYERMKRDLRGVVAQVCQFFGKEFTEEQLDSLAEHLSFDQMKKNPSTNNVQMTQNAMRMNGRVGEKFEFMRKGQIGDHKNELSEEFIKLFDEYIERELSGSDFQFDT